MTRADILSRYTAGLHTLTPDDRLALDLHHGLRIDAGEVAKRLATLGIRTDLAAANRALEAAMGHGLKHDLVGMAVRTIVERRSAVHFDAELRIIVAATLLRMQAGDAPTIHTNAKHLSAQLVAAADSRFYKYRWRASFVLRALRALADAQIIYRDRAITIRDRARLQAEADRILPPPTELVIGLGGGSEPPFIMPVVTDRAA